MSISSVSGNIGAFPSEQLRQQLFQKADTDGNGGLNVDEFSAVKGPGGASPPGSAADKAKLFSKLDADGDGSLTAAELKPPQALASGESLSALLSIQEADTDKKTDGVQSLVSQLLEALQENEAAQKARDDAQATSSDRAGTRIETQTGRDAGAVDSSDGSYTADFSQAIERLSSFSTANLEDPRFSLWRQAFESAGAAQHAGSSFRTAA